MRVWKQRRRLMGILLCGCLLTGGMPLSMPVTAAGDADIRLEAEADEVCTSIVCGTGVKGQFEKRQKDYSSSGFSSGYAFVNVTDPGETEIPEVALTFALEVPRAGTYDLSITTKDNADRGIYDAKFNGRPLKTVDFYNAAAGFCTHDLGPVSFTSTKAVLTLTCVGANEASNRKYGLAADYITLSLSSGEEPEPDPVLPGDPVHRMEDMYTCRYSNTGIQKDPLLYRLYIPAEYDAAKAYPLLVYLNGAGSRGTDNKKQLANLAPLINPLIDNEEYPCIIAVPQLPGDKQWVNTNWGLGSYSLDTVAESDSMNMLMGLIAELQETYTVDDKRLYLMGQSFGGYGTWDAVMRYPDTFAAAIPMCGAGDPGEAAAIKDIPLMVLHGSSDGSVPVTGSRDMVAALKDVGSTVTYLEYDGDDHYIQRRIFEQPDMWIPWLFAQKKGGTATQPNLNALYQKDKAHTFNFNGNSLPPSWTWTGGNKLDGSQLTMTAAGEAAMGILETTTDETDGMVSAFITINEGFTGGGGLLFRYQDSQNYGHVRFVQGGLELLEMIEGKTAVKLVSSYEWVPGRITCLKIVLKGSHVTVAVDNDRVFDTALKSEGLCRSGAAGLRYFNGSMKVDDFIFAKQNAQPQLSLQDFDDRQIIQRRTETQNQRVSFTGSVSIKDMERLELSVVSYDNAADTVLDWAEIPADTKTNTFKALLEIPQGGWYRTLVRAVDRDGNVLTQEEGHSRWGVGMNILCIGQSNMVGQGQDKAYVPADDRVSNFMNEVWSHLEDPYAAGDTSLVGGGSCGGSMVPAVGNLLVEAYDFPVGFIPAAQNGASLMAEHNGWLKRNEQNPDDRSHLYGNSLFRAQAAGGIEFILMNQGENDVSRGTSEEAYRQGLETLIENYCEDLGYDVPLIYCQLGPAMAGSWDAGRDPYMTGIRSAQAKADNGVTLIMGASEMDLERNADNLHYTTASQAIIGRRIANAIRYSLGDAAYYKGPEITGAVFTGAKRTAIDVTVQHYGGDDFLPTEKMTGFEVFADGEPVGIAAAFRKDSKTIELTLEAAAEGSVTLRYLYGCLPDIRGQIKDNSSLQLPLSPTNGEMAVEETQPDPPEPPAVMYGDVNEDKAVRAADALMALQAATHKIDLTAQQTLAADVNGDKQVTASDALLILQYATMKIDSFPAERKNI